MRLRDLGIEIGVLPTGPGNSITDIGGVAVGHCTVIADTPAVLRTGVTIVRTRSGGSGHRYGASFSFNGNGEMTGTHWLDESGLLVDPIGITNTHQVGLVRDHLVRRIVTDRPDTEFCLPVVAETYDGHLNDIAAFGLTTEHVDRALADADRTGPVGEGNVGGGTGMICHGFKGGIGTASRVVDGGHGRRPFAVGTLVQANYGERSALRLDGLPIGRHITADEVPLPDDPRTADAGSIIVVIATDAPLLADQCRRLARRATSGLARVGGNGANGSGDLFLAFSTHNDVDADGDGIATVETLSPSALTPLFDGVAEAVEESIWNALVAAETMSGFRDRVVHAVPHERLRELWQRSRGDR